MLARLLCGLEREPLGKEESLLIRPAVRLGRYWLADSYAARHAAGQEPQSIDKEFLRLWFRANCDPYADAVPPLQGLWPWAATMCLDACPPAACRGSGALPGSGPCLLHTPLTLKLVHPQPQVVRTARRRCRYEPTAEQFPAAWWSDWPLQDALLPGAGALRHADLRNEISTNTEL
jgi:hypothetical protein